MFSINFLFFSITVCFLMHFAETQGEFCVRLVDFKKFSSCNLWDGGCAGSAHVKSCFFLSSVCLLSVEGDSAHVKSCFSFLACAYSLLRGDSAHVKSCFFFSGVYLRPVTSSASRTVTPPRFARRQIVGAIRDKNFVLVSTSSLIP